MYFLLHDGTTWPKHVGGRTLRIVLHKLLCTIVCGTVYKCVVLQVKGVTCSRLGQKWRRYQNGRVKKEKGILMKVWGPIKIEREKYR